MKKILKGLTFIAILVGIVLFIVYGIGIDTITDQEALSEYIKQYGIYAPLVFFIIQFLQVVFAPIPGNITGLAGGAVFGLWLGFFLNAAAVVLGSLLMFYLGRRYGEKIIHRFVEKETFDKYQEKISGKAGKGVLFSLFLVPFTPDDILCLIAGVSKMRYKTFWIILLAGRVPSSFVTSAVGTGLYNGKMLIIIILSILYYVITFLIYWKYDKIIAYKNQNKSNKTGDS